jgi:hypothetical protein
VAPKRALLGEANTKLNNANKKLSGKTLTLNPQA